MFRERQPTKMVTLDFDSAARLCVQRLEDREAARAGVPVRDARSIVSRHTGLPEGTLRNVREGRTKGVKAWVLDRLQAALVRQLEAEIEALNHELYLARKGVAPRSQAEMAEIEAHLEAARRGLKRGTEGAQS